MTTAKWKIYKLLAPIEDVIFLRSKYIRKILAHRQIPTIMWQTGIKMNAFPGTKSCQEVDLFDIDQICLVANLNPN